MLSTIIIDDELNGRETLRSLINDFCPGVEVKAMAGSADEGITLIRQYRPDLVFLDIEMPFKNGFELLASFSEINFEVIFTTAYSHYAIKAIKFSALDYLLKPINVGELRQALKKAERKKLNSDSSEKNLDVFLNNFRKESVQKQKMVIRSADGYEIMEVSNIIRCEGDRNYTHFFLADNRAVLVLSTLKEYEELLSEHRFMRVHQSHLINLHHVKRYIKGRGGYAEMSDGSIIEISRNKKDLFIENLAL